MAVNKLIKKEFLLNHHFIFLKKVFYMRTSYGLFVLATKANKNVCGERLYLSLLYFVMILLQVKFQLEIMNRMLLFLCEKKENH